MERARPVEERGVRAGDLARPRTPAPPHDQENRRTAPEESSAQKPELSNYPLDAQVVWALK